MTLGERIYKLRTEKEMSQGDLADALEVSRQSISKWETNGSVPELDKLIKLSEIFGVSLDELLTGQAGQTEAAEPEEDEASEDDAPKDAASLIFDRLVNWLRAVVISAATTLPIRNPRSAVFA